MLLNIDIRLIMRGKLLMDLKPRLKELRKNEGLLQGFVAEKLGVRQQTLSDWENGKVEMRYSHAKMLAKLYRCKMEDLYEE